MEWGGAQLFFLYHQPSASLTMSHSTMPPLSPSSSLHPLPHPPSPSHSNLPTQIYHSSLLPRSIPTPALLDSVAGGAHYSGVESVNERRWSLIRGHSHAPCTGQGLSHRRQSNLPGAATASHLAAMDDLKEVRRYLPFRAGGFLAPVHLD